MSAIISILLSLSSMSFAASVSLPVGEIEKVIIKGTEAHIQLIPGAGPNLKIDGIEESNATGSYTVSRKGKIIEVRMNEPSDKSAYTDSLRKSLSAKTPKIEITGTAVPVEIQVRKASVKAQGWNQEVKVSVIQGAVQFAKSSAPLIVSVQKGSIEIVDHTGRLAVDSFEGKVETRNIQGDAQIRLFSGSLQGEKLKGFWSLQMQQAQVKLQNFQGTIQFVNGKGPLNIQSLVGRLEGQNQEGSITAQLALDSEFEVRSKGGKIQVQLAPGSGAAINLKTDEGDIQVPGELKVVRAGAERSVRGRVRGDAQRGRVFVRAEEATISVK